MKYAAKKILLLLVLVFSLGSSAKAQEPPAGKDLLWRPPAAAPQALDLFWGQGSESRKPVGPFTFLEEDTKGTRPKVFVTDQRGVRWGVKFGDEVHSEVAASRFFWAAGYFANEFYFVPQGVIQGASNSQISDKYMDKATGAFKNARFARNVQVLNAASVLEYFGSWGWNNSPFKDTKELSGILLMNALVANFDTKSSNNVIRSIRYQDGSVENWYLVGDIGGTFGKTELVDHSKWDPKGYSKEPFLRKATDKSLKLFFQGRKSKHFQSIPLEHARWFYQLVGSLTRSQIEDAFRAALSDVRTAPLPNPQDEALVQSFSDALESRLADLRRYLSEAE